MKTITVVIPTYNEENNVLFAYEAVCRIFSEQLPNYRLQFLYADNGSTDDTRGIIRTLCQRDPNVGAILNSTNVGYPRSSFHALQQATGDAVVLLSADLQEPPEMIPAFVAEWEKGHPVVCGIKESSEENALVYWMRQKYYDFIRKTSDTGHIPQYNGFGLFDASFIETLRGIDDPSPYLRGIVAEFGSNIAFVKYRQQIRKHGKTHYRFWGLYNFAMLGITSSSKGLLRLGTCVGFLVGIVSLLVALSTLIIKLFCWNTFQIGMAALVTGLFFIGAVLLFYIGILGEYIMNINSRVMRHPLVVEEERMNLPEERK